MSKHILFICLVCFLLGCSSSYEDKMQKVMPKIEEFQGDTEKTAFFLITLEALSACLLALRPYQKKE